MVIALRPAPTQGLPNGLTLELGIAVIDDAAQVIAIHVCAWHGPIVKRPPDCNKSLVFNGIFVQAAISELLENTMYMALDQAQSMAEADDLGLDLSGLEVA